LSFEFAQLVEVSSNPRVQPQCTRPRPEWGFVFLKLAPGDTFSLCGNAQLFLSFFSIKERSAAELALPQWAGSSIYAPPIRHRI
jgi:hypothetical protein